MDDLKNKRYLLIGGLIVIFLSLFLPYYGVHVDGYLNYNYTVSYPLIESWEGFVLILCIAACLLLTFNKTIVGKVKPIFIVIPIIIIILVLLYDIAHINKYEEYKYGIGFYLELIGIASLVAHVFLYKGNGGIINIQKSNSGINQQQVYNGQPMYNMQSMQSMPQQPVQQQMYNVQPINNIQSVNDVVQENNIQAQSEIDNNQNSNV